MGEVANQLATIEGEKILMDFGNSGCLKSLGDLFLLSGFEVEPVSGCFFPSKGHKNDPYYQKRILHGVSDVSNDTISKIGIEKAKEINTSWKNISM